MDIIDPTTGIKYNVESKEGQKVLKKMIYSFKQTGSGSSDIPGYNQKNITDIIEAVNNEIAKYKINTDERNNLRNLRDELVAIRKKTIKDN